MLPLVILEDITELAEKTQSCTEIGFNSFKMSL
jgi:hypothetical protein